MHKLSKKALCLTLLRAAGARGVTTGDFIRGGCGSRYGARLQELRDAGCEIRTRRERGGSYRYWLDFLPTSERPECSGRSRRDAPSIGGTPSVPEQLSIDNFPSATQRPANGARR